MVAEIPWCPPTIIICAHSCYCLQYKGTACFFFFPWLPIFPFMICLVVPTAKTQFGAAHKMLWVLLCAFWACNRHLVFITSPECAQHGSKACLGIIHLLWEKRSISPKGRQGRKKRKRCVFLVCFGCASCSNNYVHIIMGVSCTLVISLTLCTK